MKFIRFAAVAALTLVLTGCGNGPKAPQGTVAAAYIDLGKTLSNIEDVVDDVLGELPSSMKEMREEVRNQIKEGKKAAKENGFALSGFNWAMWTLAFDESANQHIGLAVSVDSDMVEPLEKLLPVLGARDLEGKIAGETIREIAVPNVGNLYCCILKGGLVLLAEPERIPSWERENTTRKETDGIALLVKTYKGEIKPASGFGDIDDLDGNTIARVLAPEVGDALKARIGGNADEVKKMIEETTGDEDLYDSITGLGDIMFDLNLDDDDFGFALTIETDCRSDAKILESWFEALTAGDARFLLDGALVFLADGPMRRDFRRDPNLKKTFVEVRKLFDGAFDVDRSGSTVTLEVELDTDDVIEAIVDNTFAEAK